MNNVYSNILGYVVAFNLIMSLGLFCFLKFGDVSQNFMSLVPQITIFLSCLDVLAMTILIIMCIYKSRTHN